MFSIAALRACGCSRRRAITRRLNGCCRSRYKSFPVEEDEHFLAVARYVERNPLRANLVARAEEWRWSSLWRRCRGGTEEKSILAAWPVEMPADWIERVNRAEHEKELETLSAPSRFPFLGPTPFSPLPPVLIGPYGSLPRRRDIPADTSSLASSAAG
jgi:hypothetical protein